MKPQESTVLRTQDAGSGDSHIVHAGLQLRPRNSPGVAKCPLTLERERYREGERDRERERRERHIKKERQREMPDPASKLRPQSERE